MRLKAPPLVAHSVVLAALIGSSTAGAQPSVEASNAQGAHADSKDVDRVTPRMLDNHVAPWQRPGDLIPPQTFALELDAIEPSWRAVVSQRPTQTTADDDANPPQQKLRRYHVGVQGGLFGPSTDVIELGNLGFRVERSDGQTILRYRYSLNPQIDLVAEGRYWIARGPTATSGDGKVAGGFVGPGIRVNASKGRRVVPYLQANVYLVQQMLGEPMVLYEYGFGFGLGGGVNLEVTRLTSIPVEATYLRSAGSDLDDLSGFGVSAGVNFNF